MAKNKMSDLRNHLFETLEGLKDEDKPMDIQRALAVSTVAQTIINSVKEEVQFMKLIGGKNDDLEFFDAPSERLKLLPTGTGR